MYLILGVSNAILRWINRMDDCGKNCENFEVNTHVIVFYSRRKLDRFKGGNSRFWVGGKKGKVSIQAKAIFSTISFKSTLIGPR